MIIYIDEYGKEENEKTGKEENEGERKLGC
jgi:hypothetical protein